MKILIIIFTIFQFGCSVVHIEPRVDRLPTVRVNSGIDECKWQPKIDLDLDDFELHFVCNKRVNI